MHTVEIVVLLVAVATVVAAFAKRLRVPAPSLLVAAGLAVGLLPGAPMVHVPPAVVSLVVLPPLLYAASEELAWRDLRAVWRPVAVLAVGLVLASAAAVAAVAGAVASLSASMAFVLGAVLASTDPVAVSALGRRLSLPARVQALVQAESLFNDGTSLVLFQIAVSLAVGGTAMAATGALLHGAGEFAVLAGGGAAAGAVVAAGVIVLRRRITDPVLETVAALITPYVAYLLGETLGVSGVTAVIVSGLVIGAQRSKITTAQTRLQLHSVYQTVIFVLESVVFALIGLELPTLVRELGRSGRWPLAALAVTGDPDGHPRGVGLPGLRHLRLAPRQAPPVLAGARRGVVGRHPRGGAAGRRPVHPPHHRSRECAAAAGSGAGAGRRHDRDLADRAGLHPGAAGPARRVRPRGGRARPRRDRRPAAHGRGGPGPPGGAG